MHEINSVVVIGVVEKPKVSIIAIISITKRGKVCGNPCG
jgi:hypothetical protein